MTTETQQVTANRKTVIDFIYVDLDICTRCQGTDANLDAALQMVQTVLEPVGVEVTVRKTLVDSEAKAAELGFVSSPTIRVNGRDIASELRESSCASCGEACGCGGDIDCRVWVYHGNEYTAAPVPMIVDAILSAVYGTKEGMPPLPQVVCVPENLKRFFAAKVAKSDSSCCEVEEKAVCCAASQKAACCVPPAGAAQPGACGCR